VAIRKAVFLLDLELQPNSPTILIKLRTNEINFSEFITVKFDESVRFSNRITTFIESAG